MPNDRMPNDRMPEDQRAKAGALRPFVMDFARCGSMKLEDNLSGSSSASRQSSSEQAVEPGVEGVVVWLVVRGIPTDILTEPAAAGFRSISLRASIPWRDAYAFGYFEKPCSPQFAADTIERTPGLSGRPTRVSRSLILYCV